MGITRDLTSALRESISANGLDKTKILISKVLGEYREDVNSVYHCNYCKGELSPSSSVAGSLVLLSCDSCDNEIIEYRGTVRTKRRSTLRYGRCPKLTIRCFDDDRKERVIECRFDYDARITDIEMKSGDKFSIMFFRASNEPRGIRAEIENFTVKREVSAIVSYEDLSQFGESLSIAERSYLRGLPEDLAPSV
jgi:hypothetical protein